MIKKIAKITIYVEDQEEAKKFWTEKVGFVVKFEQNMGPGMKWLEVGPSENEFTTFVLYDKKMMKEQNPAANVGHPSLILSTDEIDRTYEELKSNGVKLDEIQKLPYGSMFRFYDQDENQFLVRED